MKKINFKHFVRLYKMNRLWGDNIFEAAFYALRGKAFVAVISDRLNDESEPIKINPEDEWWQAIK